MIKTRLIAKPKSGGTSGGVTIGASGASYAGQSSAKAEKAEWAKTSDYAAAANEASHAATAADLDAGKQAELDSKYLSKINADTAAESIGFAKGLTVAGAFAFDAEGDIIAHTAASDDYSEADGKGWKVAVKDADTGAYRLCIEELKAWGRAQTAELIAERAASETFRSGFAGGYGWGITERKILNAAGVEESRWTAEFDDLVVRGGLKIYEMVVSQLVGENDNRIFAGMLEVERYDAESGKVYLKTENGKLYNPFRADDCVMVQQYGDGGASVKRYELVVTEYGSEGEGEETLAWVKFKDFTADGTAAELIAEGDTFVRVDNLSDPDRKGLVQIVSVGSNSPYIDAVHGMKTDAANSVKARLGNLAGVTDKQHGTLQGFGLYSQNAYLTGDFVVSRTGENVAAQLQVLKDKFSTAFAETKNDFLENSLVGNGQFLTDGNGGFAGWTLLKVGDDGTPTPETAEAEWYADEDGLPVMANGEATQSGVRFARTEEVGGRSVLRICANGREPLLLWRAECYDIPTHKEYGTEGETTVQDTVYLTFKVLAAEASAMQIALTDKGDYAGDYDFICGKEFAASGEWETVNVTVTPSSTAKRSYSFLILGAGDFCLTDLALTTKPLEALEATYSTAITQTAEQISLHAEKITANEKATAEVKVTAEGISQKVSALETGLQDTGIDIADKKITMTADSFTLNNNAGEKVLSADADGNLTVSGRVEASEGYFNNGVFDNATVSGLIAANMLRLKKTTPGNMKTQTVVDGALICDHGYYLLPKLAEDECTLILYSYRMEGRSGAFCVIGAPDGTHIYTVVDGKDTSSDGVVPNGDGILLGLGGKWRHIPFTTITTT